MATEPEKFKKTNIDDNWQKKMNDLDSYFPLTIKRPEYQTSRQRFSVGGDMMIEELALLCMFQEELPNEPIDDYGTLLRILKYAVDADEDFVIDLSKFPIGDHDTITSVVLDEYQYIIDDLIDSSDVTIADRYTRMIARIDKLSVNLVKNARITLLTEVTSSIIEAETSKEVVLSKYYEVFRYLLLKKNVERNQEVTDLYGLDWFNDVNSEAISSIPLFNISTMAKPKTNDQRILILAAYFAFLSFSEWTVTAFDIDKSKAVIFEIFPDLVIKFIEEDCAKDANVQLTLEHVNKTLAVMKETKIKTMVLKAIKLHLEKLEENKEFDHSNVQDIVKMLRLFMVDAEQYVEEDGFTNGTFVTKSELGKGRLWRVTDWQRVIIQEFPNVIVEIIVQSLKYKEGAIQQLTGQSLARLVDYLDKNIDRISVETNIGMIFKEWTKE